MRWKTHEEELLIRLVGEREGIWNPRHRDAQKKAELWDQVATTIGFKGKFQCLCLFVFVLFYFIENCI